MTNKTVFGFGFTRVGSEQLDNSLRHFLERNSNLSLSASCDPNLAHRNECMLNVSILRSYGYVCNREVQTRLTHAISNQGVLFSSAGLICTVGSVRKGRAIRRRAVGSLESWRRPWLVYFDTLLWNDTWWYVLIYMYLPIAVYSIWNLPMRFGSNAVKFTRNELPSVTNSAGFESLWHA